MDKDYIKEKIKLYSDWLKGLFALFILDSSAIATLLIRQEFFKNHYEYGLLVVVCLFDIMIIIFMAIVNNKVVKLIKSLKK